VPRYGNRGTVIVVSRAFDIKKRNIKVSLSFKHLTAILTSVTCLATASTAFAAAGTASGPSALALAAVVAEHSSVLGAFDRRAVRSMFSGKDNLVIARTQKITVAVDAVVCKMSNVDITARSCVLTVKGHDRTVTGRDANEIFGTLALAGVQSEGAAGSIIASVKNLQCTLDPTVIKQKAGGGADCKFDTGS
jgi:hypothetical protein